MVAEKAKSIAVAVDGSTAGLGSHAAGHQYGPITGSCRWMSST